MLSTILMYLVLVLVLWTLAAVAVVVLCRNVWHHAVPRAVRAPVEPPAALMRADGLPAGDLPEPMAARISSGLES